MCIPDDAEEDADGMMFGPDVCESPAIPSGIFGMSHAELMQSEWVINDVLTVNVSLSDVDTAQSVDLNASYEWHVVSGGRPRRWPALQQWMAMVLGLLSLRSEAA